MNKRRENLLDLSVEAQELATELTSISEVVKLNEFGPRHQRTRAYNKEN